MCPRLLRLRAAALARRDAIRQIVRRVLAPPGDQEAYVLHSYAFKCDERPFARAVLERYPQIWVYRCHQQAACGDFVLVDLSAPNPSGRHAWVVELKRGASLRRSGGGAGFQLRNAPHAADDLVRAGVLGSVPRWSTVTGDAQQILAWLGGPRE